MYSIAKILELKRSVKEYKEKQERSIAWIARKANIGERTLQKFIKEDGRIMTDDNLWRLEKFLEKEKGGK